LAGWALKIVDLLICQILGLIAVLARGHQAAAEVLMLQHENAVLRREVGRVRYAPADRSCSPRWWSRLGWPEIVGRDEADVGVWCGVQFEDDEFVAGFAQRRRRDVEGALRAS
jgi:hypothetical protein